VRNEVIELSKIFRASVVDVSSTTLTMAITGDPGKNRAFQQACLKFGIVQVARTAGSSHAPGVWSQGSRLHAPGVWSQGSRLHAPGVWS
jgi:hypothetical protein